MSSYYLSPIAQGLGDLIVSLPALEGLISTGMPTYLVVRGAPQKGLARRIPGLAGSLDEVDFDPSKLSVSDRYLNMRDHKLQTQFIWGSEEFKTAYPDYCIGDVVEIISADLGIAKSEKKRLVLDFKPVLEAENKVIFIAGSAGSMKCWPVEHFMQLASSLNQIGLECLVIGQKDKSEVVDQLCKNGVAHIETPDLESAVDVISSARMVVGVDTGLSHIAVNQGINTVMLFRQNSIFKRRFKHLISLSAPVCLEECLIREMQGDYNSLLEFREPDQFNKPNYWQSWDCYQSDRAKRCMAQISVETVFAATKELIDREVKLIN